MYSMGGSIGDVYRPKNPHNGWVTPLFLFDHPPTSSATITLKTFSVDDDNRGGLTAADSISVIMLYLLNDSTQGSHNIMTVMGPNFTKVTMNDGQGPVHNYVLDNTKFYLNQVPSYDSIVGFYLTLSQTAGVIHGSEACLSYTFTDNYVYA